MSELSTEEWFAAIDKSVTVTPQQVANIIHSVNRPEPREHGLHHSCACMHLAMYYLGVTKETGLYWPDGQGGNRWKH